MAGPRDNPTLDPSNRRRQRSLSVSAAARKTTQLLSDDELSSQFSNKRENPLFWTSTTPANPYSPPPDDSDSGKVPSNASTKLLTGNRGRSVTTNLGPSHNKESSRSLSGVRGRSVSRGRYEHGTVDVQVDRYSRISTGNRSCNNLSASNTKKTTVAKSGPDSRLLVKSLKTRTRQPPVPCSDESASSLPVHEFSESIPTSSLSEGEEKTIRAVQMKAVRMNSISSAAMANSTNVNSDVVTLDGVELVLDVRSEYERKLEESQDRVRKLRADLVVEEQRGLELSRILKELLPYPNMTAARRCLKKRTSNERNKMSKRLTEDAMAYFDECISISTFDSSDFSATEDQPQNSVVQSTSVDDSATTTQAMQKFSAFSSPFNFHNHVQGSHGHRSWGNLKWSSLTANGGSDGFMSEGGKDDVGFGEDARISFKFEKDRNDDDIKVDNLNSKNSDIEEGNFWCHKESILFEKVILGSRIGSGSLHLCGGGLALSFYPFGSFI